MNCDEVRVLLGAFIDDELSVELVARINGHVSNCLDCQEERTILTMVRSRVHDLKQQLEPPGGFVESIKARVEARLHADKRVLKSRLPSYLVLAAAAAAIVLCLLPHNANEHTTTRVATTAQTTLLSAQELYSYENDFRNSKLQPTEYDASLAPQFTGFAAQPPSFSGWRLVRTVITSVKSTKAIKFTYNQTDHGKIKTLVCYQFRGGIFDASELAHHTINGRTICCGTQDNVSLVYWRRANKDFVLASELPRGYLMSIALGS